MFWPNFIFLEHNDLITFFTIFKKIERKYFVCYEYFKEKLLFWGKDVSIQTQIPTSSRN